MILSRLNSLKYKILFLTIAIIASFAILTFFLWYTKTSREGEKSAELYISEMLKNSVDNLEVALKDINYIIASASVNRDNVLNVLSKQEYGTYKEQFDDNVKISNYLFSLYGFKFYLDGLMISDFNQREYKIGTTLTLESLKLQKWFKDIENAGSKQVVIPPHYIGEDRVISIARSVLDNGRVLGFVMADVKYKVLQDIFNINLRDKGSIFILNSKTGEFILKPEHVKLSILDDETNLKKISNRFTSANGSFYTEIGGRNILAVYYRSDFTGWTAIALIPKEKLLEGFNKTLNTTLMISVVFCIAVIFIVYFVLSLLTNNLLKLNKAVKGINKDNLDISVSIDTKDEIGQLYSQFRYMVNRIKELINDIKNKESEKRKAEIRALQAQINPHFLYNTLNTVKFLAILQGAENIKSVSESLSTLLHINMDEKQFISVREEVEYIKSYLSIQEYKYSNKFTYEIHVEDDVEDCMVLKLLLQPIVENSLVHGFAQLASDGVILIKIYKEGNNLKLCVRDNGEGMDEETIDKLLNSQCKSDRIGINNIISRVKLFFGEEYGLAIFSHKNIYTIVEVSVPVIYEEEVKEYA